MSKKTRTVSNKAGKLMKCDGQMLKKVIEAKGYKCHELSKLLRYCSDYLTTCCRTNKISDVAAKYLMDYKIFPQMYDLEGEIKVDDIVSPTEVKIDKDDNKTIKELLDAPVMRDVAISRAAEKLKAETDKAMRQAADKLNKRMDMINSNSGYGMLKTDKEALAQEAKEILNRRYGRPEKGVEGIDYGYGPAPKNTGYYGYYAAGHSIAKGLFQLMQVAMNDLKHDREFKELIKQAVKEAYEEL